MKKWLQGLVAGLLVLGMINPASAASSSGKPRISSGSSHGIPTTSSGSQNPSNSISNSQVGTATDSTGKTYNSGPQRPSSSVMQQPSSTGTSQPATSTRSMPTSKPGFGGVGSFLGGMAVGGLLGSMFHPFGGGMHTAGYGGFSFFGLFLDILIIAAIFWVIRRFWRRAER